MSDKPVSLIPTPQGYADWLADLKNRIHNAQQRATLAVNRELVGLYWQIGRDILARQAEQGWGAKVIDRLAHDLRTAFPDMKGFSPSNLKYMRAFAEAWPDESIVQQVAALLPWGHNLVLLDRLKEPAERLAYTHAAIEHGWSRNVLNIHIETRLLERTGKAVTNFEQRLSAPQSDLAIESLKDPYRFDFLGLGVQAQEREIEGALVQHVTDPVTDQVTDQVAREILRLLSMMQGEMSRAEIQAGLDLKHLPHLRDAYLNPALHQGLIEMTIPDKPRSRLQKYRLTAAGRTLLQSLRKEP